MTNITPVGSDDQYNTSQALGGLDPIKEEDEAQDEAQYNKTLPPGPARVDVSGRRALATSPDALLVEDTTVGEDTPVLLRYVYGNVRGLACCSAPFEESNGTVKKDGTPIAGRSDKNVHDKHN